MPKRKGRFHQYKVYQNQKDGKVFTEFIIRRQSIDYQYFLMVRKITLRKILTVIVIKLKLKKGIDSLSQTQLMYVCDSLIKPFRGFLKSTSNAFSLIFIMNWIEVRNLRNLMRITDKKPNIGQTMEIFSGRYFFRTTLKQDDFMHLTSIAQKINIRHKKNGIERPTKFGNSELKLFGWVVALLCHQQDITLQLMVDDDYLKIQNIFRFVEIPRIIYQIRCFCHTKGQIQALWTEEQISMFYQLVVQQKNATEWKNIAYEMFKRSNCKYFRFFQQYREKWINYLNPELKKGKWTLDDSIKMSKLVCQVGRKWAFISRAFNCMRSEHSVKNHFKKLMREFLKSKRESVNDYAENDKELFKQLMRIRESQSERELWTVKAEEGRQMEEEKDEASNEIVPQKPVKQEEINVKLQANIQEKVPYHLQVPIFSFPKLHEETVTVIKEQDAQKYNYIYFT